MLLEISGQLNNAIAIGGGCGYVNQETNSVAIGSYAGFTGQGQNCVAIGNQSGLTSQPNDSIVINAGNLALSGINQSSWYIQPFRNVITGGSTSNIMCYDWVKNEVINVDNVNFANPVSFPLGNITQTSVNFGTLNTGIWSSLANSINVSVAGTQRMDLTGSRLQMSLPIQYFAGAQNLPQIYFSTDSTSGLYRPALNNVAITTNSLLRFNVITSVISCALLITLPTTGGTATNFDYYERTTQKMIMRYSNTATI